MADPRYNEETDNKQVLFGGIKGCINKYGFLRWLLALPMLFIYGVSYSLMSPQYKTPYQSEYENLKTKIAAEKIGITKPVPLPSDLFYYTALWQEMEGENPLVNKLMTESLEYLYKTMSFLKDIQDNNETALKKMIHDKLARAGNVRTEDDIYKAITGKGEYFSRLFEQIFTQHGLKKLEANYTETDLEIFFNLLCVSPEGKKFRRLFSAMVFNVPYYLVIKNSINEYYQNEKILMPVDLFSLTLFMMYLDGIKKSNRKPSIEECRSWVFSVIVPEEEKRKKLLLKPFSVQEITREEMIMPNPGYFSKAYNKKRHKAIDIASERGTMIRSPLTGTVTYYEKSRKRFITGNFIIIKAERSPFNIFICHMDNKDYIESHSTEGELAEPIANLTPDWVHPLKKGQFFQVVGNLGKSTGAHTHIQIARRTRPYPTFDFFAVNKPYQKQFNECLYKGGYWNVYSRDEQLLLSVLGMVVSRYDSTRHFTDRDPGILETYKQLQKSYIAVSPVVESGDIDIEYLPDKIIKTYFSQAIQEKIINDRYRDLFKYYATLALHFNYLLKLQVPLAPAVPSKTIPLTPWMHFYRRRRDEPQSSDTEHERLFHDAVNKFFLYKILQLNNTPRDIRDHLLSDPVFTGITQAEIPVEFPEYQKGSVEERIGFLGRYVQEITHLTVDVTFIFDEDFCSSVFNDIISACMREGVPLDVNFGFFRYHMNALQDSYRVSKFITFPDTREFKYHKAYDHAIREFFLEIFESAVENKNYDLFRELYFSSSELSISLIRRIFRETAFVYKKTSAVILNKLFHKPYPAVNKIYPEHLHSVVQRIVTNIIKTVSWESRNYAESTYYRASESSLLFTLIYEVYFRERKHYMKLFPLDQLSSVIDAIGLFDGMFKVFCDNSAQKLLIDTEHARITGELEVMEKELAALKNSKRELQQDFMNRSASLGNVEDKISRQSELFSHYISEEEKISRPIAYLEQTLTRYRDECILLKKEKEQLQVQYEQKLEKINKTMKDLKSRSLLDQLRYRREIKKITYDKGKSDLEIIDLKAKIEHLQNEIEKMNQQFGKTLKRSSDVSDDYRLLKLEYDKASGDLKAIEKQYDDLMNILRNAIGSYTRDLPPEDLTKEVKNILVSAELYKDSAVTISMLQDQLKNDRRSLALNSDLVTRLRDHIEKLEVQIQYLRDTTSSQRERDLEEENKRLEAMLKKK